MTSALIMAPQPQAAAPQAPNAHAAARGLEHRIAGSFEEIANWAHEWDALVELTGGDIFGTFDWCRIWWRQYGYGRRLQVHLFTDRGRLVGILPLFAETWGAGAMSLRTLRLVGCDHSVSTCGPALAQEYLQEITRLVLNHAQAQGVDALILGPLAGYSDISLPLLDAVQRSGGYCARALPGRPQMIFDIPATYEQYLNTLPKKRRYEFRHEERRLAESGRVARSVRCESRDAQEAFAAFVNLHQEYWETQGQLGHFVDWPGSLDFHEAMVSVQSAKGRSFFCESRLDGRLVASEYCYCFGRRLHWFLTARRVEVGGRVGFAELVRESSRRGIREVDAMGGYYDYKKWMGARVVYQPTIVAVRDDLRARIRAEAFRRASWALNVLYYRLWFSRIAPRLPWRSRRSLWRLWIRSRL